MGNFIPQKEINEINEIVLIDVENVGYKYFNEKYRISRVIGFISKQCLYNKIDIIKNIWN